jgi:hypothetical protein
MQGKRTMRHAILYRVSLGLLAGVTGREFRAGAACPANEVL